MTTKLTLEIYYNDPVDLSKKLEQAKILANDEYWYYCDQSLKMERFYLDEPKCRKAEINGVECFVFQSKMNKRNVKKIS